MTYHAEKRQKEDEDKEEEDVSSYWITFWTKGYSAN
jgi:hypothetical protein